MKPITFDSADFELIKSIALTFPGTEESVSHYNTPSVKFRGKLMCRLHESDGFIAIRLDFPVRDRYLDSHPEYFLLPDHYKAYPYVCMWSFVNDKKLLTEIMELCWRGLATAKQISSWETSKGLDEK